MPEGHLIHRYARRLDALLAGGPVRASSPQGRFADGAAVLDGVPLLQAEAYGKHLFAHFATGAVVHVHLGQAGVFLEHGPEPLPPRPAVRLRLAGPRGAVDLIAPARCALVDAAARDAVVARLGPDPVLADPADPEPPLRLLRARTAVGVALLDQGLWAGIGNAFRAELLYLRRLHPRRAAAGLGGEAAELWALACAQLRLGVEVGTIAAVDGRTAAKWVYKEQACRGCGAPVEVGELGGRTSYHCPREQVLPVAVAGARRAGARRSPVVASSRDTPGDSPTRRNAAAGGDRRRRRPGGDAG